MPQKNGELTEEEKQKVDRWIKEHWESWVCPFSGGSDWDVGSFVTETRSFSGGGLNVGGPLYPYVVLTCKKCGYTVFINAMKIGLFPTKEGEHGDSNKSSS